jgi:tetratricopeptide (TPR) repeat protein
MPGVGISFWAAAEKEDAHIDTTVATFTCTHKHWKGQMELMTNGQFRRVDKDGGNWTIAWDARETDDGDKCGELTLTWFQWEPECLRTTDGGRTFKQQDYLFECGLNHVRTGPRWVPTGEILKTTKNYATVLGRSGKWQRALSLSEKLINDLDGRSGLTKQQKNLQVDVLDIAGRMCVELGRTGEAIRLLERAKTSRERLVPTSLTKLSAHQLSTLHHLADAYRLDGLLKQALDTYTTLASALRERVEGDHAAQVWRWQDADKRTAQDWLSAAEACIANLEPAIQARMWQQCLGGGLLAGALMLLWRRKG